MSINHRYKWLFMLCLMYPTNYKISMSSEFSPWGTNNKYACLWFQVGCDDRREEDAGLRVHQGRAQNLGRHLAGIHQKRKIGNRRRN